MTRTVRAWLREWRRRLRLQLRACGWAPIREGEYPARMRALWKDRV